MSSSAKENGGSVAPSSSASHIPVASPLRDRTNLPPENVQVAGKQQAPRGLTRKVAASSATEPIVSAHVRAHVASLASTCVPFAEVQPEGIPLQLQHDHDEQFDDASEAANEWGDVLQSLEPMLARQEVDARIVQRISQERPTLADLRRLSVEHQSSGRCNDASPGLDFLPRVATPCRAVAPAAVMCLNDRASLHPTRRDSRLGLGLGLDRGRRDSSSLRRPAASDDDVLEALQTYIASLQVDGAAEAEVAHGAVQTATPQPLSPPSPSHPACPQGHGLWLTDTRRDTLGGGSPESLADVSASCDSLQCLNTRASRRGADPVDWEGGGYDLWEDVNSPEAVFDIDSRGTWVEAQGDLAGAALQVCQAHTC